LIFIKLIGYSKKGCCSYHNQSLFTISKVEVNRNCFLFKSRFYNIKKSTLKYPLYSSSITWKCFVEFPGTRVLSLVIRLPDKKASRLKEKWNKNKLRLQRFFCCAFLAWFQTTNHPSPTKIALLAILISCLCGGERLCLY
jgi:hypothetical protein